MSLYIFVSSSFLLIMCFPWFAVKDSWMVELVQGGLRTSLEDSAAQNSKTLVKSDDLFDQSILEKELHLSLIAYFRHLLL